MFGIKSSKDLFIEHLQAELAQLRASHVAEIAELVNAAGRLREDNLSLQGQLSEALVLAREAMDETPKTSEPVKPKAPLTMRQRCDELTARSFNLAKSKGKNLVAQMPPPGVKVAGTA